MIYVFCLYFSQEQYLEYCYLVLGDCILSFLTPPKRGAVLKYTSLDQYCGEEGQWISDFKASQDYRAKHCLE